jgi:hypothetical protein
LARVFRFFIIIVADRLSGQCALWDLWYNSPGVKDFKLQCFGLVCGVFLVSFLWLFSAYYDLGGAFVLSGLFGMSVFFLIILGITLSIMNMDGQKTLYVEAGQSSHHMFGASECVLGCLVLLGNLLLTIFSIVDAARD